MRKYLLFLIPNVFKCFQFETFFSEHTSECDCLVAMVQIRLEVLDENGSECVLQVHAFFLIRQFDEFGVHRFDEIVNHIDGYVASVVNIFLFTCAQIEMLENVLTIVSLLLQIENNNSFIFNHLQAYLWPNAG